MKGEHGSHFSRLVSANANETPQAVGIVCVAVVHEDHASGYVPLCTRILSTRRHHGHAAIAPTGWWRAELAAAIAVSAVLCLRALQPVAHCWFSFAKSALRCGLTCRCALREASSAVPEES